MLNSRSRPHLGQRGQGDLGGSGAVDPNCTGIPEWNWTRRRLALAAGFGFRMLVELDEEEVVAELGFGDVNGIGGEVLVDEWSWR